ncbi:MAG: DUF998 domain-containing protein [Propionicimonas sp.]|uniref:DUF998 domain-containing protein n=1 Tax=Propionicimonas sp. TaxID=1955623 RepID=UPI002B1F693A|nr:DUF998 domain-containing protein [Propionicimonas sp.]MEA4943565.1 DUF998 domain-containing protein [Propionicimonas sp.]
MPTADRNRWLAAAALTAAGIDLAVFLLLHLVQPGVDILHQPTSAYIHGAFGFTSSLASAAVGLGGIALAAAVWRLAPALGGRIGAGLLGVFGLAKLVQAFFPIDPVGEVSGAGTVHNLLGNLAFFVLPIAAVLVTRPVAHATGRDRPAWWPVVAGWTLVATMVLVLAGDGLGFFGLAQRIYLVNAMAWTALVASWLWRGRR